MANETKKAELLEIIRECLINHGKDAFDNSAAYTEDLLRGVAEQLETKMTGYTDDEIAKLRDLIGSSDVDLQPITNLLALIKGELDGDESQEGFQALNKLISDVAAVTALTASHSQTLTSLVQQITSMGTTLTGHGQRLDALESQIGTIGTGGDNTSCDECIAEMLDIMKEQQAAACSAARTVLESYATTKGAERKAAFLAESTMTEGDDGSTDAGTDADTGTDAGTDAGDGTAGGNTGAVDGMG